VFALALVAGATGRGAAQGVGTIEGTVTTTRDGAGVLDASVFVEGHVQRAHTDNRGRFRISGVPAGERRVTVQRIGYRPLTQTVTVTAGGVVQMTFALTEAASLVDPVTVTASRGEEEKLKDLPVTVSVLSGEEIARMRPTHVGDALNRLAGVHVVSFDGDGSHNAIRQPLCCRATILIMEDGIPFAPPSFYTTSMLGGVDYAHAGQVEALKGPGTAAYGSDAVTGVVNFITANPPVTPRADLTFEGGPYGFKRALVSAGGTFGANGLQASGTFTDSDGRKSDPYQRYSASGRWNLTLPNGGLLRTVVSYNQRNGTGSDDQDPDQFAARSSFNPYPIAFDDWQQFRASTSYQRQTGRTTWGITPYVRKQNSDRVPGWQLSYDPVVWDIDFTSMGLLSQVRHQFASLNAQLTAGAEVDYSPLDRREPVITPVDSSGVWVDWSLTAQEPHYDYRATYRGGAGYAQLDFNPLARLRVSAGARLDLAGYDYHTRLTAVDTGAFRRPADVELSYSKVSPKFGLTFTVSEETRLFASYRRGFRVPLESQLFKQGRSASTTDLRPVEVEGVELGFRTAGAGRARLEVAAYYMELHNDILSYRDASNVSALTNNGETSHRGVEISGAYAFTPALRFDLAYTYARHRFEQWVPSTTVNLSGKEMDGAPRHLGSGTLTYEPRFLNGGHLQLEWSGMGTYWLDPANTTTFDGYHVFNVRASYILARRAELYVRAINLTDKLYAIQAFQGFGSIPWVAAAGQYRTLYMGMRAQL
jgi:outer membrane receptor protein involved in Fe transport